MSLEAILVLLLFSTTVVVLDFAQVPGLSTLRFLVIQEALGMGLISWRGPCIKSGTGWLQSQALCLPLH